MARKKVFTRGDLLAINKLKEQGLSNRQIAEKFGVSETTIKRYLTNFKVYSDSKEEKNDTAKQFVLSQISSRVMIKELYNRGCRIENGGLFVIEKKKVLVNDIIAEA